MFRKTFTNEMKTNEKKEKKMKRKNYCKMTKLNRKYYFSPSTCRLKDSSCKTNIPKCHFQRK